MNTVSLFSASCLRSACVRLHKTPSQNGKLQHGLEICTCVAPIARFVASMDKVSIKSQRQVGKRFLCFPSGERRKRADVFAKSPQCFPLQRVFFFDRNQPWFARGSLWRMLSKFVEKMKTQATNMCILMEKPAGCKFWCFDAFFNFAKHICLWTGRFTSCSRKSQHNMRDENILMKRWVSHFGNLLLRNRD